MRIGRSFWRALGDQEEGSEEHLANSLKAVAYIPLVIQYPDMNVIGFIPYTPGWKFAFVY
jgi:hypothetical protein